jgi:hypothetical protein
LADFQSQAMGMTGLTIDASSTVPSRAEFSTFLNDGVIDVTRRCIQMNPREVTNFQRETTTQDASGFASGGAQILAVLREADADGDADGTTAWRSCREVPAAFQSRVVDIDSLYFASKYNPVYTIDDNNTVFVYPKPDDTNDGYRVYYVNNAPEETDGTALDHASTGIKYFPKDKVYLVIVYASIKSLEAKMAEYTIDEEDTELVNAIASNITTLKQQYEGAFGGVAQQQQAGGR